MPINHLQFETQRDELSEAAREEALLAQSTKTARLNARFEKLAFDLNDGDDGDFLSGWQCDNPYARPLLTAVRQKAATIDHTRYAYFDAQHGLAHSIASFHSSLDRQEPQSVLCGCGTTSLLSTWATYLFSIGIKTVYYIPPLYITLHTALDRYGIITIPVSQKQPYEPDFDIRLPEEPRSILLLTDPIWFAGTALSGPVISKVAEWQQRTSSIVFVDGSLQYLPWSGQRYEASSQLDSSLTFRLVCPAKQLCIHGYRFSYMLVPSSHHRALAWTYTNMFGPAPADSVAFGHVAIEAIADGLVPQHLMTLASRRYADLLNTGAITSSLTPNCGYFVFAQIGAQLPPGYIQVDGTYFGQEHYPGYSKLNLLSPSMHLISTLAQNDDDLSTYHIAPSISL